MTDCKAAQKSRLFIIILPYLNSIMLPSSHNRAYQELLTLLTEFQSFLGMQNYQSLRTQVRSRFQELDMGFKQHIINLSAEDLELAIASRWQSVQTEIKREFKLLATDVLFLSTAKEETTQIRRIDGINVRLSKLISYCQMMLKQE